MKLLLKRKMWWQFRVRCLEADPIVISSCQWRSSMTDTKMAETKWWNLANLLSRSWLQTTELRSCRGIYSQVWIGRKILWVWSRYSARRRWRKVLRAASKKTWLSSSRASFRTILLLRWWLLGESNSYSSSMRMRSCKLGNNWLLRSTCRVNKINFKKWNPSMSRSKFSTGRGPRT